MAFTTIAKCIFMLINVVFLIISMVFIAVGSILAFIPDTVFEFVYTTAKKAAEAGNYHFPSSADALKDLPLLFEIGIALFVLGVVLFIISFLGCCGCCCSCCKFMLILFAIVMAVLMIVEIVVVTMFYVPDSPLHENLRKSLKDKVRNYDKSKDTTDSFSVAINMVNYFFKCCGIDGLSDFSGINPESCIKSKTPAIAYYSGGCYTELTDVIQDNILYAGLAFAGLLLFQLIQIIFAVVIFKKSNKVSPF
ncbi:unnamed protein product [Lymnaea stagnalis]|uniref:Tetraspanin n=1 Tax=Lymnaea stagnalis TaxID=6523 RepID=A0AAV2H9Y9_LYMST